MTRSVCVVVAALAAVAVPALAASENPRIPATLPFDANVTPNMRAEVSAGWRTWDNSSATAEADDLYLDLTFAFELLANLELGAQGELISRDFDAPALGSESGPSDLFVWGKYAFYKKEKSTIAGGAFLSLPVGDEDYLLGTGEVDPGAFISGGTRTDDGSLLQAHLGFRFNADRTFRGVSYDGTTSILVGFGGLLEPKPGFELFGSFDLETERFDNGETFARLAAGARWTLSGPWRLQGQLEGGMADAAPSFGLLFGIVYAP